MPRLPRVLVLPAAALLLLVSRPADAQTALPMGAPQNGTASGQTPAVYTFTAKTAGVLSVAVQGTDDLQLVLRDGDGQQVRDGVSDRDLYGSPGTELLSTTLTEAGTYKVSVELLGGGQSTFKIAASFLSFPAFERPADPDKRPSNATALEIGKTHEDTLDSDQGDAWDWFVFKVTEAGTLALITRVDGDDTDLMLEAYIDGDFSRPVDSSDQDQQGNAGNESVTIAVKAGQTVHVKVAGAFSSVKGAYRLQSSLIK
ncbi:MAG: PPC domain-containing protein [Vicinamibacterales bacterium]